jgi:hypothetical protein
MTVFCLKPFSYFGDEAILAYADRSGMRVFQSAVQSARGDGRATFELDGIQHKLVRQAAAADIEQGPQTVVWRLADAKLTEILDLVEPLVDIEKPGHQYVDLNSPVSTLTLSVNEYFCLDVIPREHRAVIVEELTRRNPDLLEELRGTRKPTKEQSDAVVLGVLSPALSANFGPGHVPNEYGLAIERALDAYLEAWPI